MIVDLIENLIHYKGMNKNFDLVIDYILNHDLNTLPQKVHYIDDKNFYNRFLMTTCSIEEAKFESHRVYADVHINLTGEEKIGYEIAEILAPTTSYSIENDILFYQDVPCKTITIGSGSFALFLPEEGHAPKIKIKTDQNDKIVFKVKW